MCQLWLNLPAKNKMDPPNYQVLHACLVAAAYSAMFLRCSCAPARIHCLVLTCGTRGSRQPILAKDIPAVQISADGSDDGVVRVIAGAADTRAHALARRLALRFDADRPASETPRCLCLARRARLCVQARMCVYVCVCVCVCVCVGLPRAASGECMARKVSH